MNTLKGQIALVTGSSRGIGAAIAAAFARHGAAAAVHGRGKDAVTAVVTGIGDRGGSAIGVTGDVTSFDGIEAIRRQIEDSLGPVDILVANAGGSFTPPAPLEDIPRGRMAGQHRRQPAGHLLDPQELPARHESPPPRRHHRGLLSGPPARRPRRSPTAPPKPPSR
jgi:NAD(P)-dependent dehydrogenase (short-subunit alcohol dehydrogenase family)